MSLTLTVDGPRWRTHLESVADAHPGIVPVAKGNGYGFTLGRLARKAQWLRDGGHDVTTLAVGTYDEIAEVATRWDGDILVLTPWRPFVDAIDPGLAKRVIHTVSRLADLEQLLTLAPTARIVLERTTSMQRHGMSGRDLWEAGEVLRRHPDSHLEGVALHLPLAQGNHLGEVGRLLNDYVAAAVPAAAPARSGSATSPTASSTTLRQQYGDFSVRPRIGTAALARRPRRPPRDGDGPRRPPRRAGRHLRLPGPHRPEERPPARRQRWYGARHRPRGADRRPVDQGPRRHPREGRSGRGRVRAVAVLHRRQAATLRRAAAHAGLDAVPADRRSRARPWATGSMSGCATPPRHSTGSSSTADFVGCARTSAGERSPFILSTPSYILTSLLTHRDRAHVPGTAPALPLPTLSLPSPAPPSLTPSPAWSPRYPEPCGPARPATAPACTPSPATRPVRRARPRSATATTTSVPATATQPRPQPSTYALSLPRVVTPKAAEVEAVPSEGGSHLVTITCRPVTVSRECTKSVRPSPCPRAISTRTTPTYRDLAASSACPSATLRLRLCQPHIRAG